MELNCSRCAWCVILLVASVGCGGSDQLDVYKVEGTLLLDDQPFGPTSLNLTPVDTEKGRSAVGQVDANGHITFTSYQVGDGVPPGEYQVQVGMTFGAPPRPFPEVYRSTNSPLRVMIEPRDGNQVSIKMDSSAGPMAQAPSFTRGATGEPQMDALNPAALAPASKD